MADPNAISIVIPARNEAAAIAGVIEDCRAFARAADVRHEIVVVDDASDDDTARLVEDAARHGDVRLIRHATRRGIAETSHAGLLAARHDVICYLDGDGQFSAAAFGPLVDRLADADLVVGWRQDRVERGLRRWGSRVYNAATRLAGVPLHDVNCGFRVLRRSAFTNVATSIQSRSSFYFAELTLLIQTTGGRVVEAAVPHHARIGGRPSGASPSVVVTQFVDLARYMWRGWRTRETRAALAPRGPRSEGAAVAVEAASPLTGDHGIDVSLVVPVYNEGGTIEASLAEWLVVLTDRGLRAECVVVDDGSTDGTPDILCALAARDPRIRLHRQVNAGHGAALLAAYRRARGHWVVQIDGDDEIGASSFEALWAARVPGGMVLGRRAPRERAPVRRVVSRVAATWFGWATGVAANDVNVPYRLLPRERLADFLAVAPDRLVAPNLALSILAGVRGWEFREVPVVERARLATRRGLGGRRLWMTVCRAACESLAFRARLARQSP